MFKDPLRELWVPFLFNAAAVLVNLLAILFNLWVGPNFWLAINTIAGLGSAWMAWKEFRKIPVRKRELQDRLLGYLRRDFG